MAKLFDRSSSRITISEFYDNYLAKKYNFDASYQRKSDVWSEDKKSFLIDSILKNYPIPAIYMRPIVDNDGKTKYDIVDGKQRLQAIIAFITDEIPLTEYFFEDAFIDESNSDSAEEISGELFSEIKSNSSNIDYIRQFWTYQLQIEYLYEEDDSLVSSVFDRLNRNGEPLNRQELRNAKYSDSYLLRKIKEIAKWAFIKERLERLKIERMEDEEFVSELLFVILDNAILDSSPDFLDGKFEQYKDATEAIDQACEKFKNIIDYIEKLNLDFDNIKRLSWTTHLYTLFTIAWYCDEHGIQSGSIRDDLSTFYKDYFSKNTSYQGKLKDYKDAASSRTRSVTQRNKRMNAILDYCGIKVN